jgi:hypothetical protein
MLAAAGPVAAQAPATPPAAEATDKGAAKRRGPADVAATIDTGIKQLEAGKAEQAVQTLTFAISGGNIPPAQMARALHQRGAAYRKLNKPAQAISDLTSALWLKNGLDAAARADAVAQRTEAYREAGLAQPGDAAGGTTTAAVTDAPPERPAARRVASVPSASTAPAPTTSLAPDTSATAPIGNPVGSFFSGLFGGSTAPAAAAPPPAPVAAKSEPATSGWSSTTTSPPAATTARIATASVAPSPAPARAPVTAVTPDGRYAARLGSFSSKADAETAGQRLIAQYGSALSGRSAQATSITFGGQTIWHLRVGPYATAAQATAACTQLKPSKLDCVPVDR